MEKVNGEKKAFAILENDEFAAQFYLIRKVEPTAHYDSRFVIAKRPYKVGIAYQTYSNITTAIRKSGISKDFFGEAEEDSLSDFEPVFPWEPRNAEFKCTIDSCQCSYMNEGLLQIHLCMIHDQQCGIFWPEMKLNEDSPVVDENTAAATRSHSSLPPSLKDDDQPHEASDPDSYHPSEDDYDESASRHSSSSERAQKLTKKKQAERIRLKRKERETLDTKRDIKFLKKKRRNAKEEEASKFNPAQMEQIDAMLEKRETRKRAEEGQAVRAETKQYCEEYIDRRISARLHEVLSAPADDQEKTFANIHAEILERPKYNELQMRHKRVKKKLRKIVRRQNTRISNLERSIRLMKMQQFPQMYSPIYRSPKSPQHVTYSNDPPRFRFPPSTPPPRHSTALDIELDRDPESLQKERKLAEQMGLNRDSDREESRESREKSLVALRTKRQILVTGAKDQDQDAKDQEEEEPEYPVQEEVTYEECLGPENETCAEPSGPGSAPSPASAGSASASALGSAPGSAPASTGSAPASTGSALASAGSAPASTGSASAGSASASALGSAPGSAPASTGSALASAGSASASAGSASASAGSASASAGSASALEHKHDQEKFDARIRKQLDKDPEGRDYIFIEGFKVDLRPKPVEYEEWAIHPENRMLDESSLDFDLPPTPRKRNLRIKPAKLQLEPDVRYPMETIVRTILASNWEDERKSDYLRLIYIGYWAYKKDDAIGSESVVNFTLHNLAKAYYTTEKKLYKQRMDAVIRKFPDRKSDIEEEIELRNQQKTSGSDSEFTTPTECTSEEVVKRNKLRRQKKIQRQKREQEREEKLKKSKDSSSDSESDGYGGRLLKKKSEKHPEKPEKKPDAKKKPPSDSSPDSSSDSDSSDSEQKRKKRKKSKKSSKKSKKKRATSSSSSSSSDSSDFKKKKKKDAIPKDSKKKEQSKKKESVPKESKEDAEQSKKKESVPKESKEDAEQSKKESVPKESKEKSQVPDDSKKDAEHSKKDAEAAEQSKKDAEAAEQSKKDAEAAEHHNDLFDDDDDNDEDFDLDGSRSGSAGIIQTLLDFEESTRVTRNDARDGYYEAYDNRPLTWVKLRPKKPKPVDFSKKEDELEPRAFNTVPDSVEYETIVKLENCKYLCVDRAELYAYELYEKWRLRQVARDTKLAKGEPVAAITRENILHQLSERLYTMKIAEMKGKLPTDLDVPTIFVEDLKDLVRKYPRLRVEAWVVAFNYLSKVRMVKRLKWIKMDLLYYLFKSADAITSNARKQQRKVDNAGKEKKPKSPKKKVTPKKLKDAASSKSKDAGSSKSKDAGSSKSKDAGSSKSKDAGSSKSKNAEGKTGDAKDPKKKRKREDSLSDLAPPKKKKKKKPTTDSSASSSESQAKKRKKKKKKPTTDSSASSSESQAKKRKKKKKKGKKKKTSSSSSSSSESESEKRSRKNKKK